MQDMVDRFVTWAQSRPDVRAGVILGSWARNDMPADNMSDLDLLVIVSDPSVFLSEASWLLSFGEPCLTFVEPTATGNFKERRVAFKDGRDIDFSLVPVEAIRQMVGQQISAEIADVFRRGFRILVDKDRLAERLTDSARWSEKPDKFPTASLWHETGHDFLYHVLLAAKKARRGELWVATSSCNGYLQNLLLRLIEWHTKGKGQHDSWHKGRFLELWSERKIVQALPDTFAKYSLQDVQRTLKANLHFYDTFGREIANAFGYDFPEEAYSFAVEQLQEIVGKADDHQESRRSDADGR
jgi:aminoglycoside 6-adenylyltransferase